MSTAYLVHHGVKGMKWGVRHDRKTTGRKRFSATVVKQKQQATSTDRGHAFRKTKETVKSFGDSVQKSQEKSLVDKGYSEQEAHKMVEDRKAFMKKLAVGAAVVGGVAITASTVYYLKNKGELECDSLIKAGTTIQTLSHDPDRIDKGRAFFTNFEKTDIGIYEGRFGGSMADPKFAITSEAQKDVKVAGYKTGKDTFEQLMKEDPEFRSGVKELMPSGGRFGYKKGYDSFNSTVLPLDPTYTDEQGTRRLSSENIKAMKLNEKFYAALSKQGYGGVEDVNDTKYSNLRGKHPTIIFDRSAFGEASSAKLDSTRIRAGRDTARREIPKLKRQRIDPSTVSFYAGFLTANAVIYGNMGYSTAQTLPRSRQISKEYARKRADINARIKTAKASGNKEEVKRLRKELSDAKEERDYQRYKLSYGKETADLLYGGS